MYANQETKKVTAAALALLMMIGIMHTGVFGVFAAGEQEPKQLLWGDVDGNGEITISDATAVQRYAIELHVENFNAKVADVNGDKRISILDVTCIQKYIAEYTTGTGKTGQPYDGDKIFTVKSVPVLRSSLDSTETATLRVYDDQPNVPYMNVKTFYDQFYTVGTDLTQAMTCTRNGGKYTLANIAGVTAVFDIDADTFYTTNLEEFSASAYAVQIGMEDGVDENHPFVKMEEDNDPAEPVPPDGKPR